MSRKSLSILGGSVLVLGFVFGALPSCGSSSGGDPVALCQQGCDKNLTCTPDAGPVDMTADTTCKSNCAAETSGTKACTNLGAIESAYKACLAMDCAHYQDCLLNTIPACQTGGSGGTNGGGGSNGGGGTTGGGGSNGGGGTSGTASCASCTKGQTCCVASFQLLGADAGSCTFSVATCNAQTGTAQSDYIAACADEITAGQALGSCN